MSSETEYKKGMRVWMPHVEKVWESAVILDDYDAKQKKLFIRIDDTRQAKILNIPSSFDLPPLYLSEDASLDITSNLTSLLVIHEASILHKLRSRFEQRYIYSSCGICTIALNPYSELPEDERNKVSIYRNSNFKHLHPHIFGVAHNVHLKLERENRDQTLIFTGESGSGKTVNVERTILYLTTTTSKEDQIKEKILASSVVLQAFGHSCTELNHDSSRFGRFIQLEYDKNYHIIGALLSTYNLDRSSIISKGRQQNVFNIFYYLYTVKDNFPQLHLDEIELTHLKKKIDVPALDSHNRKCFLKTIGALNVLEFSDKEQNEILTILAVLLHLQNLVFTKIEGMKVSKSTESCRIANQSQIETIGKLLDFDETALRSLQKWMCYKRTFCVEDEILQPMNIDHATKTRDVLVKFIYTKLFNWLVAHMNYSFRSPCYVQNFIGILEMHGFEKLNVNSFEQFCINYIDEKVEQFFIQSSFLLEQEEYVQEEIVWSFIEFADNASSIELIDEKSGILDLLDEETKVSSENALSWMENLRTKFEKYPNFEKSNKHMADFTIHHFIDSVQYNASDFLSKNYTSVAKELLEVLKETKNELFNKLVTDEFLKLSAAKVKKMSGIKKRSSFNLKQSRKTVTTELRICLASLTATLLKTKASFVRCIKTNDEKESFRFDTSRVVEQLRAYNVVETLKLSAEGYFHQMLYKEFCLRYYCLGQFEDVKLDDMEKVCEKILINCGKIDDVKFGKTKVFLREDTVDYLEALRSEKRRYAAIVIQKSVRCYLQQKCYKKICRFVYGIQPYARGYLTRKRHELFRDHVILDQAATKIQACFRGFLEYRWYQYVKHDLLVPQEYAKQAHRHLGQFYTKDLAATEIQRHVKRFVTRRKYKRTLRKIITVQSYVRRFLVIAKLRNLQGKGNLRLNVLNKTVEQNLDSLRKKVDCLMSMHLSSEDLVSVHSIMDDKTCAQSKNRILNDLLFKKIKTLQNLRGDQKPCEKQQPQPSTSSSPVTEISPNENRGTNWRKYDIPMPEKIYDTEALYEKLMKSFQKVDRDAKILQQTAGIPDEEILSLMETYRKSVQASKAAEASSSTATVQKDQSKDIKEGPEALASTSNDDGEVSKDVDIDEESKKRLNKNKYRLTIVPDEIESSEETRIVDLRLPDLAVSFVSTKPRISDQKEKAVGGSHATYKSKIDNWAKFHKIIYRHGENELLSTNDVEFDGMFQYQINATESLSNHITDIDPSLCHVYNLSPDLPAQILIMCIRYTDHKNNAAAALRLICQFLRKVRLKIENENELVVGVFWLLNTHKFFNYLRQYAKPDDIDEETTDQFQGENTMRQNTQRLRNIDIREIWESVNETCTYLIEWIIKQMRSEALEAIAVRSLLHAEECDNLGHEPTAAIDRRIDLLLDLLQDYHFILTNYSIDQIVIIQIFKPVFEFISSAAMSNILSRPELYRVSNGIHIRCNLRILERWVVDRRLTQSLCGLQRIIQAARLIQLQPIDEKDITNIYMNYDQLSNEEILQIIELYNNYCLQGLASGQHDVRTISPMVTEKLQRKLELRKDLNDTVPVNNTYYYFPFRHSRVRLEFVEIPPSYHLPLLKKFHSTY